jgi:ribonuclease HI
MGVILAIECASQRNWTNIWIESDSVLATLAFKSPSIIPWQLKNRWLKCLSKLSTMNFIITHIFRKGNHCTDKLASLGFAFSEFTWWNSPPVSIWDDLAKNRLGLPYYRFC